MLKSPACGRSSRKKEEILAKMAEDVARLRVLGVRDEEAMSGRFGLDKVQMKRSVLRDLTFLGNLCSKAMRLTVGPGLVRRWQISEI